VFHVIVGKGQSAFIPAYNTLACRAVITRETKQRDKFLSTHMKAPPAKNYQFLIRYIGNTLFRLYRQFQNHLVNEITSLSGIVVA